ncbi:hypothetical protein BOX15_Mlig027092g1, partial [Macrostomum lignano]
AMECIEGNLRGSKLFVKDEFVYRKDSGRDRSKVGFRCCDKHCPGRLLQRTEAAGSGLSACLVSAAPAGSGLSACLVSAAQAGSGLSACLVSAAPAGSGLSACLVSAAQAGSGLSACLVSAAPAGSGLSAFSNFNFVTLLRLKYIV